jgi:hypothetical protein
MGLEDFLSVGLTELRMYRRYPKVNKRRVDVIVSQAQRFLCFFLFLRAFTMGLPCHLSRPQIGKEIQGMSCNLNACSVSGHRGERVCKIGPEPFSSQRAAAVGAPEWTDDSEALQCHGCSRNFTLFRRKHHCRLSQHQRISIADFRYCAKYLKFMNLA